MGGEHGGGGLPVTRARRALALALGLTGAGCGFLEEEPPPDQLVCRSDAECAPGQVCFVDGCGNPGGDIVVEVEPLPKAGLLAQDFPVDRLRAEQNLELFSPVRLRGEVSRGTMATPDGGLASIPYRAPVHLLATGESRLIPGVARRYETTLSPEDGAWALPVGSGDYTVTLTPLDPGLPPLSRTASVDPATGGTVTFELPTAPNVVTLSGTLVLQGPALVDADMEVQALDESLRPLSQRARVARDTGAFQLVLARADAQRATVLLRAAPVDAADLMPRKTFVVDPSEPLTSPLELGNPGAAVKVTGRVLESNGQTPMAGARVALQGRVAGGGTFQGVPVLTDAQGRYQLQSRPGVAESPLTLVIVPPPGSPSRLTLQPVTVAAVDTALDDVTCPARMTVTGSVKNPEGTGPASGVRIVVEPVGALTGWPQPPLGFESPQTTNSEGQFSLALDPGEYRLDFLPGENLPRVSRFVSVPAGNAGTDVLPLAAFTLSRGRSLSGRITLPPDPEVAPDGIAANASVRFFRVVTVAGRPESLLLAQTVSDSTGRYSTVLPTR
ncbi:carboxypeptidase regulatory-like domain-containing protein [Corallococcus sp. AB049A]|uniref:Carboxypeptidase regulatory-like domain-containing protein n=1 Tax=Corallococcus interemptor TaxID=2316720 RepID=A0A3A8QT40_9BACT|nr:carboxypeptidase regulatory-like domain-containing protein [Corallococcus interemptor]RKI72552.1 carboxypeptidase regulatory-like domain-containing protein [Corallococcus sp. AB049A]